MTRPLPKDPAPLHGPARRRTSANKGPLRRDGWLYLGATDLEALCLGMGLAAWDMSEARDIKRAMDRLAPGADYWQVPRVSHIPWVYETITPMARLALHLYATGLFSMQEAVHHTHPGETRLALQKIARVLLRKVREQHPAALRAMEEGFAQMKTPLDQLADSKLEAAHESLAFLRSTLHKEEVPIAERIAIAKDFLDRLPETSKVSRNEVKTQAVGGVQLPAEAAARLAAAAERATRMLLRTPEEITLASRGTDPLLLPEAEHALLAPGTPAVEGPDEA